MSRPRAPLCLTAPSPDDGLRVCGLARRVWRTTADLLVGTIIVMTHAVLADRQARQGQHRQGEP